MLGKERDAGGMHGRRRGGLVMERIDANTKK